MRPTALSARPGERDDLCGYTDTGSALVAMAMHASWTGWQFYLSPAATTHEQDVVWHVLLSAGIWAVVIVVAARSRLASPAGTASRLAVAGESR